MTRTKKALIVVLTAICLLCMSVFTLVACGGKGNDDPASISLDTKEVKTSYVVNEKLDLTGLKVYAQYEGKDDVTLTADDYTVSPANGTVLDKLGSTTVTVSYKYSEEADPLTKTFRVSVHNNIASISVKTQPEKTEYWSGEEAFDATGLELEATLEDGTKQDIDLKEVEYNTEILKYQGDEYAEDAAEYENQNVTFTYLGKTATVSVNVKANPITNIEKTADPRLAYMQGESFDLAGIKFKAVYKSGTEKDLGSNDVSDATHDAEPFMTQKVGDKIPVKVNFHGYEYPFEVTIVEGLAIEAEDGEVKSTTVKYETDAVYDKDKDGEWDDKYLASGDVYLAELNAGDTVSFSFVTDKAGKISIAFRMSSKYLKADSGWIPQWMGDCQFNKIAKFYVNGEEYPIDDTVILPGGGSKDGEPNFYLWFNWAQVAFNNIDVIKGINTITLEYVKHDYKDTSQSSFSGTFSANVDCLKIVSEDVAVSLLPDVDKVTVTNIELTENEDAAPKLVFTANITQINTSIISLTDAEIVKALEEGLKVSVGELESVTCTDGVATITVALDNVVIAGDYEIKIGYGTAAALTLDVTGKEDATYDALTYKLANIMSEPAAPAEQAEGGEGEPTEPTEPAAPEIIGIKLSVVLNEEASLELSVTEIGNAPKLVVEDEEVYFVVENNKYTTTIEGITNEELIKTLISIDLQQNIIYNVQRTGANNDWTTYFEGKHIIVLGENNTFTVKLVITSLNAGNYGSHLYHKGNKTLLDKDGNYVPVKTDTSEGAEAGATVKAYFEAQTVKLNGKSYTVSFNDKSTWGCVNIDVANITKVTATNAYLDNQDGKAVMVISGTIEEYYEGYNIYFATVHNGNWATPNRTSEIAETLVITEGENGLKNFTVTWDLASASGLSVGNSYYLHFGGASVDLPAKVVNTEKIEVIGGGIKYTLIGTDRNDNSPEIKLEAAD